MRQVMVRPNPRPLLPFHPREGLRSASRPPPAAETGAVLSLVTNYGNLSRGARWARVSRTAQIQRRSERRTSAFVRSAPGGVSTGSAGWLVWTASGATRGTGPATRLCCGIGRQLSQQSPRWPRVPGMMAATAAPLRRHRHGLQRSVPWPVLRLAKGSADGTGSSNSHLHPRSGRRRGCHDAPFRASGRPRSPRILTARAGHKGGDSEGEPCAGSVRRAERFCGE